VESIPRTIPNDIWISPVASAAGHIVTGRSLTAS